MIRPFTFVGGGAGPWRVVSLASVVGAPLAAVTHVSIAEEHLGAVPSQAAWMLRGVTSHERYVTRDEHDRLAAVSPPLGRIEATCAALIPIRKSPAWWALAQDERRAILETRSAHVTTGLEYLPAVARRLHHCRDLGEPFDFVTWFEYARTDADAFEALVGRLRQSEEWGYVDREVDIRLVREP